MMKIITARINFAKNCAITTHTSSIVCSKKWEKLQGVMIDPQGWHLRHEIKRIKL